MMRRLFSLVAPAALLFAAFADGAVCAADLKPFDAKSMDAIRASRAGKPFVLALWSVYCEPCREEMEHWAVLQRKHPNIPILLVATDPPADRAAIETMLARYELGRVQTWAFADDYVERVRHAVDPSWRGELPRSYFFDAAHRAHAFSGRLDPDQIESWFASVAEPKRP